MKRYTSFLMLLFTCSSVSLNAQLTNGSIAPDFTYTDINGTSHNLYTYLNQGKSVVIDVFAAHCPTCWAYHNTHALKDLNDMYGPSGSVNQDMVVLGIEHDPNNGTNEIYGISGNTQGNWDDGFPIINVEGTDRVEFITNYAATFYPMVYIVCPDKTITYYPNPTTSTLYNHSQSCAALNVPSLEMTEPMVYLSNAQLRVRASNTFSLVLFDLTGKQVYQNHSEENEVFWDLSSLPTGMYIYRVSSMGQTYQGKIVR